MSKFTTVSVFGNGALGGALIDLVRKTDLFVLHSIWGSKTSDNKIYSPQSGKPEVSSSEFPEKPGDLGKLIFLAVPDDAISNVAHRLSEIEMDWSHRAVVHLSGSKSAEVLAPVSDYGAKVASMHPLQTFTRGDNADRFSNIWFTLQGDESVFPVLNNLIDLAGAHSNIMSAGQKSAMHLAAVFASNYLVSLMYVAEEITEKHGIENGLEMMEPIVDQTIKNIFSKGAVQSLSGPVARGDSQTIQHHLSALKTNMDQSRLYRYLGEAAVDIALKSGQIDKQKARQIRETLKSGRDGR